MARRKTDGIDPRRKTDRMEGEGEEGFEPGAAGERGAVAAAEVGPLADPAVAGGGMPECATEPESAPAATAEVPEEAIVAGGVTDEAAGAAGAIPSPGEPESAGTESGDGIREVGELLEPGSAAQAPVADPEGPIARICAEHPVDLSKPPKWWVGQTPTEECTDSDDWNRRWGRTGPGGRDDHYPRDD